MNNSTFVYDVGFSVDLLTIADVCMYSLALLVGLPTHTYVIRLIATGSGLASDFIVLNLCVCEILSLEVFFASVIVVWFTDPSEITWFLLGPSITGRPLFQCLTCVERFLAVVHPVTFLKLKPLRYRVFCAVVAWTFILASSLCCLASEGLFSLYMSVCLYSAQFLFFFCVQLFCCLSVLRVLKQSGPGERKEENHRKRRAFNLILISTVSLSIIYVPIITTGFAFSLTQLYITEFFSVGFFGFAVAGILTPAVYLLRKKKCTC